MILFNKESMHVDIFIENFYFFEDDVFDTKVNWANFFLDNAYIFSKKPFVGFTTIETNGSIDKLVCLPFKDLIFV